tara:strand:- start:602 stop:1243 length:642 start_codon:yes stop_codon:yes gene_type:complete
MRRGLFFLIILISSVIKIYSQVIYSADGISYGQRKDIINNYLNESKRQGISETIFMGSKISIERFCNCIVDFMPFYNYDVFQENYTNGTFIELLNSNNHLKKFFECSIQNYKALIGKNESEVDNIFSEAKKTGANEFTDKTAKIWINNCIEEMKEVNKRDNLNVNDSWIKDFCECQQSKIWTSTYSLDEMNNPKEGGSFHKEVIMKCIEFAYR